MTQLKDKRPDFNQQPSQIREYKTRPRCYKTFFMLNSAEIEIYTAHKQSLVF